MKFQNSKGEILELTKEEYKELIKNTPDSNSLNIPNKEEQSRLVEEGFYLVEENENVHI